MPMAVPSSNRSRTQFGLRGHPCRRPPRSCWLHVPVWHSSCRLRRSRGPWLHLRAASASLNVFNYRKSMTFRPLWHMKYAQTGAALALGRTAQHYLVLCAGLLLDVLGRLRRGSRRMQLLAAFRLDARPILCCEHRPQ